MVKDVRCEHGRKRCACRDCWRAGTGGASFCAHGCLRYTCKVCGGGAFCSHGRRDKCKVCGGREAARQAKAARAEAAQAKAAEAKAARAEAARAQRAEAKAARAEAARAEDITSIEEFENTKV